MISAVTCIFDATFIIYKHHRHQIHHHHHHYHDNHQVKLAGKDEAEENGDGEL